jgi:hypothetical protein
VIALGVFGARPRDVDSGAAQDGRTDGTLVFFFIAQWSLAILWLAIGIWESLHLQHKLHTDRELAGELEKNEISHTGVTRRWLRLWRQLNAWTAAQAVGDAEARTSPMYRWIAAGVTWFLIATTFVTLGFALADKTPEAVAGFNVWAVGRYTAAVLSTSCIWFDLSDRPCKWWDRRDFNVWVGLIGEAANCAVAIMLHPDEVIGSIGKLATYGILCVLIVRLHKRALAGSTLADRRKHVLEVRAPEKRAQRRCS